jgi:hypothetical protein
MCARASCSKCGKPSYVGCGRHVEQVLKDVPKDQRCRCREDRTAGNSERKLSFVERPFGKP